MENLSIFIHFKLPEDTDFGDHSLKKENARVQGQLGELLSQVDSDSGPDYRKTRGDRRKGKSKRSLSYSAGFGNSQGAGMREEAIREISGEESSSGLDLLADVGESGRD